MRDEAMLRPCAIARVAGLTPQRLASWVWGTWTPGEGDVPLLAVLTRLRARVAADYPDAQARRRWWCQARRELGWLSPAELLRRGRVGEVFLLLDTENDAADSLPF